MSSTLPIKNPNKLVIYLPAITIALFLITEFVSKFLYVNNFEFHRVSAVVKFCFEILALVYIFLFKKKARLELLKILLYFSIAYLIGQFAINDDFFYTRFINNIYTLNGYMFIFILYTLVAAETKKQNYLLNLQLKFIHKVIRLIILINCVCIFLGLFFDIDFFRTYLIGDRFGYNGLFLRSSHSSYIYIILLIFLYEEIKTKKQKLDIYLLILMFFSSFIIGTKTVYLFNFVFLVLLIIRILPIKLVVSFFIINIIFLLVKYEMILTFLGNRFKVLKRVYVEDGFFTAFFSYRDKLFFNDFIPFIENKWTFFNYLFGGANFYRGRVEIEPLDFLWFFGLIGTLIYWRIIYKAIKKIKINRDSKLLIITMLMSIIIGGNFFANVPIMVYVIFLYFYFRKKNENHKLTKRVF